MKKIFTTTALLSIALTSIAQTPAFPGAEGHGRYTTGGRGGTVVHVTNLNDKGAGSLRDAVSKKNRIVVFDVSGIIALSSDLSISDNVTIEGQTAPSPGITIRYYTVRPGANNIIRFIRIRRGEERNVNDGADALWQREKTGMIIDHCSFSWSIDEVASFYDNNNFTMQWCTIGESLNNAGHNKGAHGYGGIWGGKLASFHHNLILHVNNRSPRFNGARYNWKGYNKNMFYDDYKWENSLQAEIVDFRNCVIYNTNGCYGGPGGGRINMVGNYYKSGPTAKVTKLTTASVADSGNGGTDQTFWGLASCYHLDGNVIDGKKAGWEYMQYDNGLRNENGEYYMADPNHYYGNTAETKTFGSTNYVRMRLDTPAPTDEVTTHTASTAYDKVLAWAGMSLDPDDVDLRYAEETQSGEAFCIGSVTSYVNEKGQTVYVTPQYGRIDKVADQGSYNLASAEHPNGFDTDGDGMPDAWERANGLDPDKNDANDYTVDPEKYYTNIEVYCNSLVQEIMLDGNADAESTVKEYYPAYVTEKGVPVAAINKPSPAGISTVTASHADFPTPPVNLSGQRVGHSYKGIVIENGRKIIRY